MKMSPGSKNKLSFITDSPGIAVPKVGDKRYDLWKQANNMVITWPHKSMKSTIKQSVMWINTVKEIWTDLEARYDRGDAYRLSDLLKTFYMQKQGSMTIDEYFTRI